MALGLGVGGVSKRYVDEKVAGNTKQLRKTKYPGVMSIVFDDGLSGNYQYAYPLLKKYNIPATFAISAGKIDTPSYMTTLQIQEMHNDGLIEMADHEYSHTVMTGMTQQQIIDDLALSRTWFLNNLGVYPNTFVYPGGYTNNAIRNILYPLYRRARSTADLNKLPVFKAQKNTPWELPWVGWNTAWFSSMNNYINYVRNMLRQGLYVVAAFHDVSRVSSGSVVSDTYLEALLQFVSNENIEIVRLDGLNPQHNWVKDPSFEDMSVGALIESSTPANNGNIGATWDKNGSNPNIVIDDTMSRSGVKSLKLSRNYGDGLVQNSARTHVPAFSNDKARFSLWYKGSHTTGCKLTYDVSAYNELGMPIGSVGTYSIPITSTDWTLWSYDMAEQTEVSYYIISLSMPEQSSSEVGERIVWVDDVCFNSVNNRKFNEIIA